MGGSISKYNNGNSSGKTSGMLTEKKSLAVQTDFEMDFDDHQSATNLRRKTIVTVSDPRSPTTMFARTPIQVQVTKSGSGDEDDNNDKPIAKMVDNIANLRNKHLETAKNMTEFDSPLNIKMKFVEHATILNDKIERIRSRNLIPKSRRFVTVIDSQTSDTKTTIETKLKPYLETNLDDEEDAGKTASVASQTPAPVYDPVQNAIDKMTEKLNDFSMLKVQRAKKPNPAVSRPSSSKDTAEQQQQPITNYVTPKRVVLTEKTRTPFSEIQSRIPVGKARKQNEIIKKKLNVNLVDENNENSVAIDPKLSSNLTLLEPKAANWDTNKTILF